MTILTTPYQTIEYDEAKSLILNVWMAQNSEWDEANLKNDLRHYMKEVIERCQPRLVVHDVTNFRLYESYKHGLMQKSIYLL